jgi:hypothetical protein
MLCQYFQGTTLLIAYDVLLGKDQNVVSVYLSNIGDILASFCTQVDSLIQMQAFGKSYTSVQAQGLVPGQPGFANQTFPLAGNRTKIVSSAKICIYRNVPKFAFLVI